MTVELWDPKRAALTDVALRLMKGHVVVFRKTAQGYEVSGGPLPRMTYHQRAA